MQCFFLPLVQCTLVKYVLQWNEPSVTSENDVVLHVIKLGRNPFN